MKILAVADVHSPRHLEEFVKALAHHEQPDVFLFAGDMIKSLDVLEMKSTARCTRISFLL
ncbi:MAG: metallophosphoesterase [Candidatus Thorarchaeota archaeon]